MRWSIGHGNRDAEEKTSTEYSNGEENSGTGVSDSIYVQ
jgi:hypothetical protein